MSSPTERKAAAMPGDRCRIEPVMTFTGQGLILGATALVPMSRHSGKDPKIAIEGAEERVLALLSVAYAKTVSPGVLGNLRRAAG